MSINKHKKIFEFLKQRYLSSGRNYSLIKMDLSNPVLQIHQQSFLLILLMNVPEDMYIILTNSFSLKNTFILECWSRKDDDVIPSWLDHFVCYKHCSPSYSLMMCHKLCDPLHRPINMKGQDVQISVICIPAVSGKNGHQHTPIIKSLVFLLL